MERRAKALSSQDVLDFLENKGLSCYAKYFEDLNVDGGLLITLQDNELSEIGVDSALDRLKITTYFKRLVVGSETPSGLYSVDSVAQFLEETRPLQQFVKSFKENEIDGELLLNASDDVMNELGVVKGVHKRIIRQRFQARVD